MNQCDAFADLPSVELLESLTDLVSRAAAAIMAIDRDKMHWWAKSDSSPITIADQAANVVISEGLSRLLPGVPVVSEEEQAHLSSLGQTFILVDPLDGTREFLAGRDEFTVNLAIIRRARPVAGVIAAPALGVVWRGVAGRGAERLRLAPGTTSHEALETRAIHARRRPAEGFVVATSRSHFDAQTDALLKRLPVIARSVCGSSLKFVRIAEGNVDLYARLAQTCEWDVAAGHAIVAAAGGIVTAPNGAELTYGAAPDFHVPGFIAFGDASAAAVVRTHGLTCST